MQKNTIKEKQRNKKDERHRKQKEKFHSGLHDIIGRNPIISKISQNVSGINNPTKREMIISS